MCVCVRMCALSPCNPPSLLVHCSLVTYLLLHMLTWWAPTSGCGPGLGCSQPCAQGLLTVQGGSLSQPAAQTPLSSPGALDIICKAPCWPAATTAHLPGRREPGQMAPACRDSWRLGLTNSSILSTRSRHFLPHLLHVTSDFSLS